MLYAKLLAPFLVFWALTAYAGHSGAEVKSYREWKTEKVLRAQQRVTLVKTQMEGHRPSRMTAVAARGMDPNLKRRNTTEAASTSDLSVEKLERQLKDEQYGLDLAKDLTVTDYFVGYLTKVQNKKAAFSEVAGKLSPEEIAELMNAYANSVFGSSSADLPASASNMDRVSPK